MKRTGTIIGIIAAVCIIAGTAICVLAPRSTSHTTSYTLPAVTYDITGTAKAVDVTFSNPTGGTEQYSGVYLPVQVTYNSFSDSFVYISAQNDGSYGSVTVSIYVNGNLFKTSTSSGAYVIATASGSILTVPPPLKHTLSVSVSPPGAGSVSPPGGESVLGGVQVTLTATPASGYTFDYWSGSASGTTSTITIIMDSDKSLTANFKAAYTLTVDISPPGGGSVSPAGGEYEPGSQVTLTATPTSGYTFDYWDGATSGSSNTVIIVMDSDKTITAHFTQTPGYSRSNPVGVNSPLSIWVGTTGSVGYYGNDYEVRITLLQVIRGNAAWQLISEANMFNDPPESGFEYILAKVRFEYLMGPTPGTAYDVSTVWFDAVSSDGAEYDMVWVVEPDPSLDSNLYPGASHQGWVAFQVAKSDAMPLMTFGRKYDGTGGIWFKLY